ncbi:serine/threonine-protein kinase [Hahella sp. SMD15-11]|uniref:Serine/threonine-protein kinase n=1 Tax=Thermohahella caldifontis TaxID=3142973 RepID=A0AB39UWU1_9GAMM
MTGSISLAAANAPPFWEEGHLVNGRYRIHGCNRLGGACLVYKATDTWLTDPRHPALVAIKTLRPEWEASQEARNALRYETRVLREAFHPGVVRVHDLASLEGRMSIVMDWIPGVTLGRWVNEQGGTLPVELRFGYFLALIRVVSHLHEQGIVHGDIKPSNIIVRGRMQVVLADFGLARLLAGPRPPVRLRGCTPDYTLPDRPKSEPAGIVDDQYACLCILSRMCFGTPDITAADPDNRAQAAASGVVRRATEQLMTTRKPMDWEPFVRDFRSVFREGRRRWRLW